MKLPGDLREQVPWGLPSTSRGGQGAPGGLEGPRAHGSGYGVFHVLDFPSSARTVYCPLWVVTFTARSVWYWCSLFLSPLCVAVFTARAGLRFTLPAQKCSTVPSADPFHKCPRHSVVIIIIIFIITIILFRSHLRAQGASAFGVLRPGRERRTGWPGQEAGGRGPGDSTIHGLWPGYT